MNILEIKNLSLKISDEKILKNINFEKILRGLN